MPTTLQMDKMHTLLMRFKAMSVEDLRGSELVLESEVDGREQKGSSSRLLNHCTNIASFSFRIHSQHPPSLIQIHQAVSEHRPGILCEFIIILYRISSPVGIVF